MAREYDQQDYNKISEWLEEEYARYTDEWDRIQGDYDIRRNIIEGIEGRISGKAFKTALSGILRDHDAQMDKNLSVNNMAINGILSGLFTVERIKAEEAKNG